jgi:tetratricopeptide (TPR) repeat protein
MSAAPQLVSCPRYTLLVLSGPHTGESFTFDHTPVRIGRALENEVPLGKDPKVSRVHVEIRFQDGQFGLHNVSEKNTFFVNEQNVRNTLVHTDCSITVGDSAFEFHVDDKAAMLPAVQAPKLPQRPPAAPQRAAQALAQVRPVRPSPQGGPGMAYVQQENSRILFYVIILVILSFGAYVATSSVKKRAAVEIRTTEDYVKGIEDSKETLDQMQKDDEKLGMNTPQYQLAEQQYTKGFRDYRQGQYNRAIVELQSAIAFFPQHSRARRYLTISQRKLDEQIKLLMNEGLKYKGQGNARMCAGAYGKALRLMTSVEATDVNYKEAKQFHDECEYEQRSHY